MSEKKMPAAEREALLAEIADLERRGNLHRLRHSGAEKKPAAPTHRDQSAYDAADAWSCNDCGNTGAFVSTVRTKSGGQRLQIRHYHSVNCPVVAKPRTQLRAVRDIR